MSASPIGTWPYGCSTPNTSRAKSRRAWSCGSCLAPWIAASASFFTRFTSLPLNFGCSTTSASRSRLGARASPDNASSTTRALSVLCAASRSAPSMAASIAICSPVRDVVPSVRRSAVSDPRPALPDGFASRPTAMRTSRLSTGRLGFSTRRTGMPFESWNDFGTGGTQLDSGPAVGGSARHAARSTSVAGEGADTGAGGCSLARAMAGTNRTIQASLAFTSHLRRPRRLCPWASPSRRRDCPCRSDPRRPCWIAAGFTAAMRAKSLGR